MDALTYVELNDTGESGGESASSRAVSVHAGFPNPAAERSTCPLSLDRLLIRSPCSTYFMRIQGHNWVQNGIYDGDIAIVDRARTPRQGGLVVSFTETGELVLQEQKQRRQMSRSAVQAVWGVVTAIIHQYDR